MSIPGEIINLRKGITISDVWRFLGIRKIYNNMLNPSTHRLELRIYLCIPYVFV